MFLKLLIRNLQMLYRTLKSVLLRPFTIFRYKLSSLTNISKLLNRIPKFFSSLLAKFKLKPEKREDYVDAGQMYIAKSLLIIILTLLIAIPLLVYFVAWPWVVSMFLTAKFYTGQPQIPKYTGKVAIFYEQKMENLLFKGRLKDGKYIDLGQEYYKNGRPEYIGNYVNGQYEGSGTLYAEDGKQIYTGSFKAGLYEGAGDLLLNDGSTYKGEFAAGKMDGKGEIFQAGKLFYEGDMKDDQKSGNGKEYYSDGSVAYDGSFAQNVFEGNGTEYAQGGKIKYKGSFSAGLYSGQGKLFDKKGPLIYEGNFVEGLFSGNGRYYDSNGQLVYDGSFLNGLYDGKGKLYNQGSLYYDGSFLVGMMSGNGTLSEDTSGLNYTGAFENNDIAFGKLFNLKVEEIYKAFTSGLTEDTSQTDYFYLYNKASGLVLKLAYANDKDPAKLSDVFTVPKIGSLTKIQSAEDFKLPGVYEVGPKGDGAIDGTILQLLGAGADATKFYKANYAGYGVTYWTNPTTGDVVMVEYYPSAPKPAGTQAGPAAQATAQALSTGPLDSAALQKDAVYFQDLGLDMGDFASLDY
ncbi:hypothetical protein REC12_24445 [Desulfosporosinus sp. PR]|uniref:MORN repeat-containing protein n=1 Tax=Candidatus Desulfosporosinus nitrosoreducens TaxID=3401928 RepID=UPI00280039D5|nr:hypothetical protein [Desulfosporosinus sp. PR]MDQ7096747.1 hypothetical protein [Desulfosporosinus sp. PR]